MSRFNFTDIAGSFLGGSCFTGNWLLCCWLGRWFNSWLYSSFSSGWFLDVWFRSGRSSAWHAVFS
ncbi:hypothetical protein D3C85_377850 [compost metagenome]